MVSLRESFKYGRGDFAVTHSGERVVIKKIDYRGSEGTLVDSTIVTIDDRQFKP